MELQKQTEMVKFLGHKISLTDLNTLNLPDIVKREVLYPKLNDKEIGSNERQKTTARIVSMFQIKFDSSQSQNLAMAEYGRFLQDYSLTSDEVLEAYRMVAKLQLLDHKGEPIKFYPNLSIGQAGEILKSYQEFKIENPKHTQGISQIKAFLNPPEPEPTEEQKQAERAKLRKNVENCFKKFGECEFAFLIYDDLKKEGVSEEFRKPERVEPIKNRLMAKFLQKEITRNLFYNATELRELSDKFKANEKYKTPGLVVQEVKSEIIKNYFKSLRK